MNDLQPKTMTIRQVADSLGVSYALIIKRVNELFPGKVQNGKITRLNEYEVTAISVRIKENSSLITSDDRRNLPTTQAEEALMIVKGYELAIQRYKQLKTENELLKPKAELADKALRDESKHYSITDAGKHIGLSQSKMFALLREKKLITSKNLPTQKAIDMNLLQLRTNADCNGKNRPQSIMTMEQMDNFRRRYVNETK
jgi:phage antirepressor YoqD-like protein